MFKFKINKQTYLKILNVREAERLFSVVNSNRLHLRKWLSWVDGITEKSDVKSFIERTREQFASNDGFQAGIWYQERLVGVIGYHKIDWKNKRTTIGYWIDKNYQGKGIITECCKSIVNYAFRDLGLNKVEIRCAEENIKSRAIPERLGFMQEGVIRQVERLEDYFVDHVVYGVLKKEWNM